MSVINAEDKFPAATGLIWFDCEQGSDEWFECRLGVPTASNFSKIVDTKGNSSRQALGYIDQLIGEAITGETYSSYKGDNANYWLERGTELEDEARNHYMGITGADVEIKGFGFNQILGAGCSPDGLIGDDGGLEIKCPSPAVHNRYLRENRVPPVYYQQVMGSLLVTGRQWWDFFSYHPQFKRQLIVRIERNEEYLEKMELHITNAVSAIAVDVHKEKSSKRRKNIKPRS